MTFPSRHSCPKPSPTLHSATSGLGENLSPAYTAQGGLIKGFPPLAQKGQGPGPPPLRTPICLHKDPGGLKSLLDLGEEITNGEVSDAV